MKDLGQPIENKNTQTQQFCLEKKSERDLILQIDNSQDSPADGGLGQHYQGAE